MAPLRLFLADDHEIVRYGLRTLLEREKDWVIVGEAADGAKAVEGILSTEPDIALLDIGMPVVNGLDATRQIVKSQSRTQILVLSAFDSKEVIRQVIDSGARGFVLKSDAVRDLIVAVEEIRAGGTFFTPKTAEVILDRQLERIYGVKQKASSSKKSQARPHKN